MSLSLSETFELVRPSIVALISTVARGSEPPSLPEIIGTGFFVDERGIVLTNRHVAERLQILPHHPKTGSPASGAIVFGENVQREGGTAERLIAVETKDFNIVETFNTSGPWYGESVPDIAFIQLAVQGVPKLDFCSEPKMVEIGRLVATAGFASGEEFMMIYDKVTFVTPLLRHGIISSVFPFPCPRPHGFTMDIMQQGGASGSPVFPPDSALVIGMLEGGCPNTNLSWALPANLLHSATVAAVQSVNVDLTDVPSLEDLISSEDWSAGISWTPVDH